jgi:hypothetical protein
LNTSVALDSAYVINKLVSPPHSSRAITSEFDTMSDDDDDDASIVRDASTSLGPFLETQIAKSKKTEHAEFF